MFRHRRPKTQAKVDSKKPAVLVEQTVSQPCSVAKDLAGQTKDKTITSSTVTIPHKESPTPKRMLFQTEMSTTFIAEDAQTQQEVVVKVLPQTRGIYDPEKEITITKLVQPHNHVVRLISVNPKPTSLSMTLELATQGDLFDFVQQFPKSKLPVPIARRCFTHIASAVAHLHKLGVAWRDIKPENVLVTATKGDDLSFVITDFGMAQHFPPENQPAKTWARGGTREFASPEVLGLIQSTTGFDPFQSDIWSLGILFYSLLFGDLPAIQFAAMATQIKATPRTVDQLRKKKVKFPAQHEVGDGQELIREMLQFEPTHRCGIDQILDHPFLLADLL